MSQKKQIYLMVDPENLIELKRTLFRNGLTAHQFFGYIAELTALNDHRIDELMQEAQTYKKQRIIDGKQEKVDAETLYRIIEEELQK